MTQYIRKHGSRNSVKVSAGRGTSMQILVGPEEAPHFAMRKFTMEPGGGMPRHTNLVEHERGRYVCPLLYPNPTGDCCPIDHKQWSKDGCSTTIPTSIGARIRYQLDRQSDAYKQVYKQRTATERINSQAVALGIEHPKLRNGQAIANLNTLIYVLINLRALKRIRARKAKQRSTA